MKNKINILTRTANRPVGFSYCNKSITEQTYTNYEQLVSYDDKADLTNYLSKYNVTPIYVDRDEIIKNDNIPSPGTGKYSPHNLYCNDLLANVTDGYVMFLDDDDMLIDNTVLEQINNSIVDEDTILFWKMRYPNGNTLPRVHGEFITPMLGNIGSPCFLVHVKWAKKFTWDGWKCGDFRYIKKVFDEVPKFKWLDKTFIQLNNHGDHGNKNDLK